MHQGTPSRNPLPTRGRCRHLHTHPHALDTLEQALLGRSTRMASIYLPASTHAEAADWWKRVTAYSTAGHVPTAARAPGAPVALRTGLMPLHARASRSQRPQRDAFL